MTATPHRSAHSLRYWFTQFVLLAVFIVACGFGVVRVSRWYSYRQGHIVTRDAAVSGRMTEVGPRIAGQVARVEVREGQRVTAGQILASLADEPLRARLAEARADVVRAEETLAVERLAIDQERRRLGAELDRRRVEIEAAEASVVVAESYLPRWSNEFERTEQMVEKRAVSANRLDQVRASRDAAEATRALQLGRQHLAETRHTVAQIDLEGVDVLEANLKVLEAEVEMARAAVRVAEAELASTVLRAPGDGLVGSITRGPSASVRVGQPILSLWLDEELWVDAWIDEAELGDVHMNSEAFVSLDAHPGEVFEGRVDAIVVVPPDATRERAQSSSSSPILASRARIRTRIRFDARDLHVIPGLSAVVGIERREAPEPGNDVLAEHPARSAAEEGRP